MKKSISLFIFLIISFYSISQVTVNDFGRIVLNPVLNNTLNIPQEAKDVLLSRLNQIASNSGMGGNNINPRFIVTANVSVGSKDIIPGPPQMIAQNLEVTLFIGDALKNSIFSNLTLSLKGVGVNENKSFIEAFKTINPKSGNVLSFCEEAKNKIVNYYSAQCDFIIKDAEKLASIGKYEEAIFNLSQVPEVSKDCYFKCFDVTTIIFQKKIDSECKLKLQQAKVDWLASQNQIGANKVADLLGSVHPMASCSTEVNILMKSIESKLKADEKTKWQFKMKQYADKIAIQKEMLAAKERQSERDFEISKLRLVSYREVAVEYARNQPKTINYNNIYWK